MTRAERQQIEERAIWISALGALFMAVLGLVFALFSGAEAIALDAIFSLIGFAVALLTLKVARLVRQPGTKTYPFGFSVFEPMLNMAKGLLIGLVLVFAATRAVMSILAGGNPISVGVALVYALVATAGCAGFAATMHRLARKSQSPIVEVDVKNWIVDTVLSGGVTVSFGVVMVLEHLEMNWAVTYADPVIVLVLCVLATALPIQIIRVNWRQIIGTTPSPDVAATIRDLAEGVLAEVDGAELHLRAGQMGRLVYAQMFAVVPVDSALPVDRQDELRRAVYQSLSSELPHVAMDLSFVGDAIWFERTWGGKETG